MSRFSIVSLVFAAISLVCFGGLRVVYSGWVYYMWVPLALTVIFSVAVVVKDHRVIREFLQMKTMKNGMNMGVMILMFFAIIVLVNFLAARNSKTFDLTKNSLNSLSPQSVQILSSLKDPVSFKFFYAEGEAGLEQERTAFRELIRKYQEASSKVELEYIDMNQRPDIAHEFEVKQGGGIVFVEYQGRRNRIDKMTEQSLTEALLKVSSDSKKTLYFVEGHGEADLFDSDSSRGLAALRKFLEGNQYEVKSLSLLQAGTVPENADAVAVVGPNQTFLDSELMALEEYLARGGSLFVAVDPEMSHGLESLFEKVQIEVEANYIGFVLFGRRVQPTVANSYSKAHQITKVFQEKTATAFRFVSSLKPLAEKKGLPIKVEALVRTPASSLAFDGPTTMTALGKGPHTLMSSVVGKLKFEPPQGFDSKGAKYGESGFKMVLAGDSDFLRNQLISGQFNNRDLAMNVFSYLAGDENKITIRPPQVERTKIEMTETSLMTYTFGFIIPLPLLLLAISIVLGIRRRHA